MTEDRDILPLFSAICLITGVIGGWIGAKMDGPRIVRSSGTIACRGDGGADIADITLSGDLKPVSPQQLADMISLAVCRDPGVRL